MKSFNPQPKPTPKVPTPRKPLNRTKKKKTGELELFFKLNESKSQFCEICGKYIPNPSPFNFHHIKPKSTHPHLRLDPNNIQKICNICHFNIHNNSKHRYEKP